MKVNDNSAANKPTRAGQARQANAGASTGKVKSTAGAATEGSTVSMSSDVDDIGRISAAAQETPEVRPEVVEQIKAELESGQLDADPDLLVVDLMMEEVDAGTNFVKELKALGNTAPIYMLSSVGDNLNMTVDYNALGLSGVFQKPIENDKLLGILKAKLG